MRLILTGLAATLALVSLMPEEAEARRRGYRKTYDQPNYYYYRRPASVAPNGLCQRDTGTPTSQLNFRNKCDTEEFWNRTMQGGRRR